MNEHAASLWKCSIDTDIQHGHVRGLTTCIWTCTCSRDMDIDISRDMDIDIDIDMHRQGNTWTWTRTLSMHISTNFISGTMVCLGYT
jgi:hypothetical protein